MYCICFLVFIEGADADGNPDPISLDQPLSAQGTLSFRMKTDKDYKNGKGQEEFVQALVEFPDFAGAYLQRIDNSVNLFFLWAGEQGYDRSFQILLPELPGPEEYYLQFTWDADSGLSEGYLNGTPMRCPGTHFAPWKFSTRATRIEVPVGPNRVEDLQVLPRYMPPVEALKNVPEYLVGKRSELLGTSKRISPMAIDNRKGRVLYKSSFCDSTSVEGWILEGPGLIRFEDRSMIMESKTSDPPTRGTGHLVYWCPEELPDHFVAEWEFEALKKHGLCLVLFAARGAGGEDLFDPSLPDRSDAHWKHYTQGVINSYHICYFVNLPLYQTGHPTSNLCKNNQFCTLSLGPVAVRPGTTGFHSLCLIKDGAHIQLQCDGEVSIDFTDPGGERWGPVFGAGKLGLRQMAVTRGAYRNFRVHELKTLE
ncbi:MAG: DUF1961 family protein [Planctomycetota bacterium]